MDGEYSRDSDMILYLQFCLMTKQIQKHIYTMNYKYLYTRHK